MPIRWLSHMSLLPTSQVSTPDLCASVALPLSYIVGVWEQVKRGCSPPLFADQELPGSPRCRLRPVRLSTTIALASSRSRGLNPIICCTGAELAPAYCDMSGIQVRRVCVPLRFPAYDPVHRLLGTSACIPGCQVPRVGP